MKDKEKLIKLLRTGNLPNLIIADLRTFQWLKTSASKLYEKAVKKYGIGGGNFTTALVCFTSLDLLAQIYSFLRKGIPDSEQKVRWHSAIQNNKELNSIYIDLKEKGFINEDWDMTNHTNAFKKLINDSKIWTKYGDIELNKIWDSYRNSLSHMSFPKEPVFGIEFKKVTNYSTFIKKLEKTEEGNVQPFVISDNNIICYHDILLKDVIRIKEWLITKIQVCDDENKIITINNWIKDNYKKFVEELD